MFPILCCAGHVSTNKRRKRPKLNYCFAVQGASVDPRDKLRRTPLFLAAAEGATESVQALIDGGADVTIKDVDRQSCVRVAVEHTDTMKVLLQV